MKKAIQIAREDNVATVTSKVKACEKVEIISQEGKIIDLIESLEEILFGHKIAIKDFKIGEKITKYGEVIGYANEKISTGQWVHTHNVESGRLPTSKVEGVK
jgi:altronate dehydratase small subunit